MKKTVIYTYLGTNGTISSPVFLEGIYSVKKINLSADEGKRLTKDNINFTDMVIVPEEEVEDWEEV